MGRVDGGSFSSEGGDTLDHSLPGETNIQSFIVKIWLGEDPGAFHRRQWRGYITHVPSGRRKYLARLRDAVNFMETYLSPQPHRDGENLNERLNLSVLRRWFTHGRRGSKPLQAHNSGGPEGVK